MNRHKFPCTNHKCSIDQQCCVPSGGRVRQLGLHSTSRCRGGALAGGGAVAAGTKYMDQLVDGWDVLLKQSVLAPTKSLHSLKIPDIVTVRSRDLVTQFSDYCESACAGMTPNQLEQVWHPISLNKYDTQSSFSKCTEILKVTATSSDLWTTFQ